MLEQIFLWVILPFSIIATIGIFVFYGLFYGAMYQRIPNHKLDKIIRLGNLSSQKDVLDLGAGFGAITFEAALSGAKVIAVEIDPSKVFWMRFLIAQGKQFYKIRLWMEKISPVSSYSAKVKKHIIRRNIEIIRKNLLDINYSSADIIYCYLFGPIMQKVGEKAKREMKRGAKLISVEHKIDGWKPTWQDKKEKIYVYTAPTSFPS